MSDVKGQIPNLDVHRVAELYRPGDLVRLDVKLKSKRLDRKDSVIKYKAYVAGTLRVPSNVPADSA